MSSTRMLQPWSGMWWEALELRDVSGRTSRGVAERVLREYTPVGFVSASGTSDTVLSLEQLRELLQAAEAEAEQQKAAAAAARRADEDAAFEATFSSAEADVVVERGRWAGFTKGDAAAWCWNLFQYEPRGFAMPGWQVRAEALITLRGGGLPEVFGYPERARALTEAGVTPRDYRWHREVLGSKRFDPADVRHR